MNSKKAKKLRKLVFDDSDFRKKEYILERVEKIIGFDNDNNPIKIERGVLKNNGLRKYYQQLKKGI